MKSTRLILATLLALTAAARALTVPVAQDTVSSSTGKIAANSGKAVTLAVNAKQTALIRFDLDDTAVVPAGVTPENIRSATLRLYVVGAKFPADVTVHTVTTDWKETFTGAPVALPTIVAAPLATITAAELRAKSYVHIPLTVAVRKALEDGAVFGFALRTADAKARITFASKEGAASGYSAELEIVADSTFNDGDDITTGNATVNGTFSANSATFGGVVSAPSITAGSVNLDSSLSATSGTFSGELNAGTLSLSGGLTGIGANFTGNLAAVDAIFSGNVSAANVSSGTGNFTGTLTGAGAAFSGPLTVSSAFRVEPRPLNAPSEVDSNVFIGLKAGESNTTGGSNSFFGFEAGQSNTVGIQNNCFGYRSGKSISTGVNNLMLGFYAGSAATTGIGNTFVGVSSGQLTTTQGYNTTLGYNAQVGTGFANSTAIGANTTVSQSDSVVLGNNCRVGIGTSTPNSKLQVVGSLSLPIRRSVGNGVTTLGEDDCIYFNGASNAVITLPSAVGIKGRFYIITNRHGTVATVNTSPATETIDGGTGSYPIATVRTIHIISDGVNWLTFD